MDGSQGVETRRAIPAPPAKRAAKPKPRSTPLGIVLSALTGFVVGAAFWHFVGFWSFVNEAVLYKRAESLPVAAVRAQSSKAQSRQGGVAAVALTALCSSAMINRSGGETKVGDCEGPTKIRISRGIQKADYADFGPTPVPTLISGTGLPGGPAVSGWSARINTDGLPMQAAEKPN